MHHLPPPPMSLTEIASAITIGCTVLGLSIRIMVEDWRHARSGSGIATAVETSFRPPALALAARGRAPSPR
ncbi:MAG TPA: hypothetical protein VME92_09900 [Acetobacteraceae bacterium]|nr:hypothetical protein [Acetobacteraceae bacterium]